MNLATATLLDKEYFYAFLKFWHFDSLILVPLTCNKLQRETN